MNAPLRPLPSDDECVAELLASALAELEAGRSVDLGQLCAQRSDLLPIVAEALGLRGGLTALHAASQNAPAGEPLLARRYRLLEPIGRGAAGAVWRARDEKLHREVAVKLLHEGLFGGPDAQARFRREALVLGGHEHPHIVRIHDQGETADGATFLVTELLRGRSLQAVLDASRAAMPDGPSAARFARTDWLRELLPQARLESTYLRQVVRWIVQLGEGLIAAHRTDVCHRDVKPSNAFIRDDGTAVLLDFGIAARTGDPSVTRTHAIVGTPCYMAPEQATGRSEPHPTLDVHGLAATLYHLLTLRPPRSGDLQQVLIELRSDDPIPAGWLHRALPRDLQAILDRGLERQPRHRYPTMDALVADLRAFLDHLPVSVRPLGPWRRNLRRMARRPVHTLAVFATIALVVTTTIAAPAWMAVSAYAAAVERDQILRRLPADLCIEGRPEQRALVPIRERGAVLDELDQLLSLDTKDLGIRLLRAAERLDAGDHARAAEDLSAMATHAATPYLRALADRYAAIAKDGGSLSLVDLPEPESDTDCFVAGFHALRGRDCERADALLTRAVAYLPARDLRLLAILGLKKPDPERAFAEAHHLEGVYGGPTARTQHTIAAALLMKKQYAAAIPHCERALELRPDRHGPWNNLGLAFLRTGRRDDALRCYERAVALRPWFDNSLSGLCQTLRQLGRFDEARAAAQRMGDLGWREYELGNVELAVTLVARANGDTAEREAAAAAAIGHFDAAIAAAGTTNPKAAAVPNARRLAAALAAPAADAALLPFLAELSSDPRNPRQIMNLADLLADVEITDELRDRLRLWLLDLAITLAPEDATIRDQRQILFEFLRSRR
ncbi:MAG: protein kinase [Planctomycetes bacterium]|nr:protein kinase [Planctomycetota bacterium]